MTTFTFTSEDLEKINKEKKQEDKIFPRIHNVRIAEGLMQENNPLLPDWYKAATQMVVDATRGVAAVLKNENKSQTILHSDSIKAPTNELTTQENEAKEKSLVIKIGNELTTQGLSEQQINDFKFMTNQGNIGSIAADFLTYFNNKNIFEDPEKRGTTIQNVGGSLAQLEITKTPPGNQEHLTYKTATRITFDKDKNECHYSSYGMCSSYEISSKDNLIIIAEVNLGPLGAKNYTPKVTCSISAEGKISEGILQQIEGDIFVNQKSKSTKEIKAEYEEIAVKTLQMTGFEDIFKRKVKADIELILSQGYILENPDSNRQKLGAIRDFNSAPRLFAEVLVGKIDEAIKQETPEARKQAIQDLSKNVSVFIYQPSGYMNILIHNIAQDRATKAGQELPKKKFIQRCKDKIDLMFATWQNKTASQNIKIIRETHKAKSVGLSR